MRLVNELTTDELQELRGRLFHQMSDDGSMEEVLGKEVEDEDEIPMDLVKSHYAETFFVEEDFWCNNRTKEEKEQADILRQMQAAGFNVMTCGNCGSIVLGLVKQEEYTCPDCAFTSEPCDFPDLYTT